MGVLVLVRPANQALIVLALLPLALRGAPWERRLTWAASLLRRLVGGEPGLEGARLRFAGATRSALKPSSAVLATAAVLCLFFVPALWRRRLAVLAIPVVAVVVALNWSSVQNPVQFVRTLAQSPPSDIFLFRAFEVDGIVSPGERPCLATAGGGRRARVARERAVPLLRRRPRRVLLLRQRPPVRRSREPRGERRSAGRDRGSDPRASVGVREGHRRDDVGDALVEPRVRAGGASDAERGAWRRARPGVVGPGDADLPTPSEGEPIPSSRVGPSIRTLWGPVRTVWFSPTQHGLVFDDPRDERRYERFEDDTNRLIDRIPTRDTRPGLVHRLNQASYRFPPPFVFLAVGLVALAVRRPRRALAALAPSLAGLVVIAVTGAVTIAVGEYAAPVTPAFVMLAAVGLVGAHPRGRLRFPGRRSADELS